MKKKILLFSSEPGGAEVLSPVVRLLLNTGEYDLTVLAYSHGLSRFAANSIACIEVERIVKGDGKLIERYRPEVLITSATSLPEFDMSEKYLWETAKRYGVRTIAFLDQWQNYTPRFSGSSAQERLAYLPDIINCIDACGREEMLEEGFPETILMPLGQPYLSDLVERYRIMDASAAHALIPGGLFRHAPASTVLFITEAIREHFVQSRGYDQFDALRLLLDNAALHTGKIGIVVKLHPKDSRGDYEELIKEFPGLDIRIVSNELKPIETLCLADTVFGMTSIMLIEAFILGKRVVSLQPRLKTPDELILTRQGLIPLIKEYRTFDIFDFPTADPAAFPVFFDEARFLSFINRSEAHHDS